MRSRIIQPNSDTASVDRRRLRTLCLIAAVIYPLWGLLLQTVGADASGFELPTRIAFSIIVVGIFALSFLKALAQYTRGLALCALGLVIAHNAASTAFHDASAIYALGFFSTVAACAAILQRTKEFLVFSAFVILCALWFPDNQEYPKVLLLAAIVIVLFVTYYSLNKRVELAAIEREDREQIFQILESITDGFYFLDREFNFLYINGEAEKLLGRKREEIIGKNGVVEFPGIEETIIYKNFTKALESNETCMFTVYYEPLDKHFDTRGYPSPTGLSVYFKDITEQVEAERSLKLEQVRMNQAEQSAHFGNFEYNFESKELYWSEGLYRIYEVDKNKVPVTLDDFLRLIARDEIESTLALVKDVLKQPREITFEHRIYPQSGATRWVSQRTYPLIDASGAIIGVRGVVQDITEQKRAEMRSTTSAKMASLGQMAAGIAHEINNPLAIIQARAEQLREAVAGNDLSPQRISKTAEKIVATSIRIGKIVKSLRAFAREGENDPFETIALSSILSDTLEFCRERFRHHNVMLECALPPEDWTLECRPVQISQVFLNLLNNSFDAIVPLEEKWVRIECRSEPDFIHISVTDSGSGIPQEHREKLFEPFFTTKEVGAGTGLGLSVSRGIAATHRGSLSLDHNSSHTSFILKLPKACSLASSTSA